MSGLVALGAVVRPSPEVVPAAGLAVLFEGQPYELVSVGERTAVLAPPGGGWEGRISKRLELCMVDPEAVTWTGPGMSAKERVRRRSAQRGRRVIRAKRGPGRASAA